MATKDFNENRDNLFINEETRSFEGKIFDFIQVWDSN